MIEERSVRARLIRPRSLRVRLVVLFVVLAGAAVALTGIGMAMVLDRAVWSALDAALEEEAHTILVLQEQLASDRGSRDAVKDLAQAVSRIGDERDLGEGKFIRVLGADGSVRASAGRFPDEVEARAPRTRTGKPHARLIGRDPAYRSVWYESVDGGWVAVGVRAEDEARALRRGRWMILAAAALLVAVLAVLGWILTGRATVELERMARELRSIQADSLHRRIAGRNTLEVDQLAQELNRLLSRLQAAVDLLRRFTTDAAHELRTPIAALRAHLGVALARPPGGNGDREGLLDALEQAERLGRLAEDLLTLSSIEAGSLHPQRALEPVRVDHVAREVAEAIAPLAQEQERPFTLAAAEPAVVLGSASLLKRLLVNLLDNALRHTPPTAAVALEVAARDATVCVRVVDGGPGVAVEESARWFQRFARGSSVAPGSGLGLSLCAEIVRYHGGSIAIDSSVAAGTTVSIELPAERAAIAVSVTNAAGR